MAHSFGNEHIFRGAVGAVDYIDLAFDNRMLIPGGGEEMRPTDLRAYAMLEIISKRELANCEESIVSYHLVSYIQTTLVKS